MPSKASDEYVKFGPCDCEPEIEDYELRRSDDECPQDVKAQYECNTCGMRVELYVDPSFTGDIRGTPLTGREGWTDIV